MAEEIASATNVQRERMRIFQDVILLLEYLGQRADSRLQAHFSDTRGDLAAPIRKLAAPPCHTYRHFLSRLVAIGGPLANVRRGETFAPAPSAPEAEGDERLDDLAFLYFSRDFLAAVAAPATVDTIRVTHAYIHARRHSFLQRLVHALRSYSKGRSALPAALSIDGESAWTSGATRLAFRVAVIEYGTILVTVLTLAISTYAFAGHLILDRQTEILADYDAIGKQRADLIQQLQTGGAPISDELFSSTASCGGGVTTTTVSVREASLAPHSTPSAAIVAAAVSGETARVAMQQWCALAWRLKHANENIVGVNLHLISWTRVALRWRYLGDVFGIDTPFIQKSAGVHDDWCNSLNFKRDSDGYCRAALQELIYRTREVADSLLGSIALYVLPTLYGALGAAAATLRALRRKVDQSLVTMTDRGRVQQDVILGLFCGAIIGFFAGYIGKGTATEGLGLSALALLAGYNVAGMFAFLDELSNRLFRPAQDGHAETRAG